MGHITISLEDVDEIKLRKLAETKYNSQKGSLAKIVSKSLELFSRESARELAMKRQLKLMNSGFNFGKVFVKERQDIYDRF